jgi:hypothetical protein
MMSVVLVVRILYVTCVLPRGRMMGEISWLIARIVVVPANESAD